MPKATGGSFTRSGKSWHEVVAAVLAANQKGRHHSTPAERIAAASTLAAGRPVTIAGIEITPEES
jgi:hypothetical protein